MSRADVLVVGAAGEVGREVVRALVHACREGDIPVTVRDADIDIPSRQADFSLDPLSADAMAARTTLLYLNPDMLSVLDRRILKEAFRQARKLQARLALDYER